MDDSHDKIFLNYQGPILYDTIGDLISLLKETMFEAKVKQAIYKKVLMIMIEALENIFKYHEFFGENEELIFNYPPSIIVKYSDHQISVRCSNPILKVDSEILKKRLIHINRLDKAGIKDEYKQTITNGQFSEKGGAGLGIIEMAKISDDKLTFSFNPINEEYNNYNLEIKIKCC